MIVVSWIASVLVVVLLAVFVGYLVSLRRLPTAQRIDLRIFDRCGRLQEISGVGQPRRK